MGTGQGKLPLDVVTDNALRKRKYEQDELEGAQLLMVTTTSDGGLERRLSATSRQTSCVAVRHCVPRCCSLSVTAGCVRHT